MVLHRAIATSSSPCHFEHEVEDFSVISLSVPADLDLADDLSDASGSRCCFLRSSTSAGSSVVPASVTVPLSLWPRCSRYESQGGLRVIQTPRTRPLCLLSGRLCSPQPRCPFSIPGILRAGFIRPLFSASVHDALELSLPLNNVSSQFISAHIRVAVYHV